VFRFVKNIGHALYRMWFYLLVAILILLALPLLVVTTLSERTYPQFFWLARNIWAKGVLYGMGCVPKVTYLENLKKGKSYMLVANHTSMLDIMLMLYVSRNPFVFVGKQELAKLPLFGFFYRRVCILVDRNDAKSRTAVYRKVAHRLKKGLGICIFPEGGVPEESVVLDTFKDGAFRMAIAHAIPVVPMAFLDCKKRFSWTFFSGAPGPLRVIVHPFFTTVALKGKDTASLRKKTRLLLLKSLQEVDT